MSRMHYLKTAPNGEPSIWWSWQDLRGGVERKGSPPKGFCTNGRAWLKWSTNGIGVEWHLFSRSCRVSLTFSSTGDDAISFAIAIPFLFALYAHISSAKWVKRLPGVRYVSGDYNSGEREIRIAIYDNAIWWSLWRNGWGMHKSHDWRDSCFHFDDFLFGRSVYSETKRIPHEAILNMPERSYPVKIELFTSIWTRPRWPFPRKVERANIEIPGGIGVPGKGENSWDMDDDAIYGGTYAVSTVEGALQAVRESALRDRNRYGGKDWVPPTASNS